MSTDHSLFQRRLFPLASWWDLQRRLMLLGSPQEREREAAVEWFVARGAEGMPALQRALNGSPPVACGAAAVLYRLGDARGVRTVLVRCYEEEWLSRCVQHGHLLELLALRRIGRGAIAAVLTAALEDARRERNENACLAALIVSLSALRVLAIFEEETPFSLLERAARFGPASLRGPDNGRLATPAASMTAWIRMEAVARLLSQHRANCLELLVAALSDSDRHVVATAIDGLRLLRDRRALPHLQTIAFQAGHVLAAPARRAVEQIAGSQADALILLRAATEPSNPEELLRGATPDARVDTPAALVRPVSRPFESGSDL
jgi:hypothetical protein